MNGIFNWPRCKNRVIELAVQEFELWSAGDLKEYDVGATSILDKYWRSVKSASEAKSIVEELQADPDHLLHPWSAVFISSIQDVWRWSIQDIQDSPHSK